MLWARARPSSRSRCRSSLVRGQAQRAWSGLPALAAEAGNRHVEVGGDPLPLAELADEPGRVVVPGPLLELEAEAGELLLEDAGALHVVADDRPAGPVDVEEDRPRLGADPLAEVPPGGEPGERVGPAEDDRVEVGFGQEPADPLVFGLDVEPAPGEVVVAVVAGRIGGGRQARRVGAVVGRVQDPVVGRVRQRVVVGDRQGQRVQVDFGRHVASSARGPSPRAGAPGACRDGGGLGFQQGRSRPRRSGGGRRGITTSCV